VRPNLTLTYGVGWDIDTPYLNRYYGGKLVNAFVPGQQSTVFPTAPLGVLWPGDRGVNSAGGVKTPYHNFAPRLGFAWAPGASQKWSVHAGVGMYYNRTEEELNLQFQGVPPNSIASTGATENGGSPSFANPFADIAGVHPTAPNLFPFVSAPPNVQFLATNGNLPVWSLCCSTIDPNNVDPTSYNYNLTVERQVSNSMIASVGYVGALGRHLELGHPLNLVTTVAPCLANSACNVNNQLFTEPGDFLFNGAKYGTIDQISNMGNSHYNSLQAGLKKKMSHGLQFTANYTWSHSFDNGSGFENTSFGGGGFGGLSFVRAYNPYLPYLNYGPSIYDARNRVVIGYVYELPHPRTSNGLLSRATKGWAISGITTFQSGFPMDVIDVSDPSLHCYGPSNSDFACMDVPNLVAPVKYFNPRKTNSQTGVAQWFSASSFASAAPGNFGLAPRNLLHGPGINNFDFQLFKDTNISETTRLELRMEFYNLFNHENFWPGGISNILQSPTFGQATADNPSTGQGPRLIQIAAKFYF
jgi:hypothetical protein